MAAERGTQGLRQTWVLGRAGDCRVSRVGVGNGALFGSTRESRRSWGSGKIHVAMSAIADLV